MFNNPELDRALQDAQNGSFKVVPKSPNGVTPKLKKRQEGNGLIRVQTANRWLTDASGRPMPKRLYGDLWYEGELAIVFADTGKGKTIKAVQIADNISFGKSDSMFPTETEAQPVLYFDFELSDKQFEARYSRRGDNGFYQDHYVFSEHFLRAEIDPNSFDHDVVANFDQYLVAEIESAIDRAGAKVVILDNITYLRSATETAKDALPLMKELIRLKKKYGLSILVLAHTPKRDLGRPLTVNDLQGSKMLSNFADSIFAIGESATDKSVRYIKQIKARSEEIKYDAENVAICRILKEDNFLRFEFIEFGREREHLNAVNDTSRNEMIAEAKALSKKGLSQRGITEQLNIGLGTVNKYLKD